MALELFTDTIAAVRDFMERTASRKVWQEDHNLAWPKGGGRNIVLREDLGLDLGSPEKESVSCLLWTEDLGRITDGRITLVGPDFPESLGHSLPFGKVVLAGVTGFDEDNAYDRHKDMDYLRYSLDLKGFMLRAVSQFMREWCRISTTALHDGFNAHILGSALIHLFRSQPFVQSVEVLYITSSTADVLKLKEITAPAEKIIGAMNKMASEMDFDCAECDYQEVCDEATELKAMREKLMQKKKEAHHG
jgi:CO dehydrogenase/acetyl-CoA synthase beta subunit